MSIIQGPPGTGKTQTILSIIANLIIQGRTVEIVSNNNSAVENVKEKLERYNLSFILASLGSYENKENFILSQSGTYPDISTWEINEQEIESCCSSIREISKSLDDCYEKLEKRQKKISELTELETESLHFSSLSSKMLYAEENSLTAQQLMSFLQKYSIYFGR